MNINQDNSCIVIFKDSKFHVYSLDPFKLISTTDIHFQIQHCEMLLKTNFLGIVGKEPCTTSLQTEFKNNQFMLWDDYSKKPFAQIRITNSILAVKIRIDTIVLICEFRTYIYDFLTLTKKESIETIENKNALGLLCQHSCNKLLVTLGLFEGEIKLNYFNAQILQFFIIKAHQSKIQNFAINFEGTLIATTSILGTIIRVFDCSKRVLLFELRRGFEIATISSMVFHETSKWLAVASNLLTIHIFKLDEQRQEEENSTFSILKSYLPKQIDVFLSRQCSFHQFRISDSPFLLAFSSNNYFLNVFTLNGQYYKVRFDPNHKEDHPLQLEHRIFFF